METRVKTPSSPSLPWRTRIYLSFISWATDAVSKPDGTVNRRFLRCLQPPIPSISIPIFGVKTYDVVINPTSQLWFRVFVPKQHVVEDLPLIMCFHGGGFVYLAPNVKIYDTWGRRIARKVPAIVVSVGYRRAPEHRYPVPHNDCFDVLKLLDVEENRSKWLPENVDISRCFLLGDSAGGNIAHYVAQRACEFNFQRLQVIGLISIQPFFGGEELTDAEREHEGTPLVSLKQCEWYWKALMPPSEGNNRDHTIINVSGPNAMDISKYDFPVTMVVVSGFDPLRDWQNRYYEWLKKSKKEAYLVEYPNMCHSFYVFREVPESEQLLSDVKDFIHKVCSNTN
uniref:probable carboxylesterase 18 n=1 Tax=Erigeron canadensis TaxID=72917 RepID=UPI001CB8DA0C|nr:probable carboxylesterase 18 [Erigeron canadensis]